MSENLLDWTERDGVFYAESDREVPAPYDHAYFTIEEDSGFRPGRPDETSAWLLTHVQTDDVDAILEIDLGRHYEDVDAAQAAAERYEQTGAVYDGEDGLRYRDLNLDATLSPQDPGDDDTRPCITVGGVQVYAYFDEDTGQLCISAHYDTADPAVVDPAGRVPTVVTIGATTVYEA